VLKSGAMNNYELTILIKPDLGEKEVAKEAKNLADLLEKAGAKIIKKLEPAKKALAYEIKKLREAYYFYLELELKPEAVLAIDQKLKLQENTIRYLLVRK
jgi:small subunit ribosomal protein S6